MEGNLQLLLCPRGGDEEKKRSLTVGDFKSLKNDPRVFKIGWHTFSSQLRVVTPLYYRANHWNC